MATVNVAIEVNTEHLPRLRRALEVVSGLPDLVPGSEPPVKTPLKQLLSAALQATVVQQERSYNVIDPPTIT